MSLVGLAFGFNVLSVATVSLFSLFLSVYFVLYALAFTLDGLGRIAGELKRKILRGTFEWAMDRRDCNQMCRGLKLMSYYFGTWEVAARVLRLHPLCHYRVLRPLVFVLLPFTGPLEGSAFLFIDWKWAVRLYEATSGKFPRYLDDLIPLAVQHEKVKVIRHLARAGLMDSYDWERINQRMFYSPNSEIMIETVRALPNSTLTEAWWKNEHGDYISERDRVLDVLALEHLEWFGILTEKFQSKQSSLYDSSLVPFIISFHAALWIPEIRGRAQIYE